MIINDLSTMTTKLEVWKVFLSMDVTPEKYQFQMELNTLLLKEITPETLNELQEFIRSLESLGQ